MNIKTIFLLFIREITPFWFVQHSNGFLINGRFMLWLKKQTSKLFTKKYLRKRKTKHGITTVYKQKTEKRLIFVCDELGQHPGLADRFAGIIALYKVSKMLNIRFNIYMKSPFILQNFIVPNNYDWIINNESMIYESKQIIAFKTFEHRTFMQCWDPKFTKINEAALYNLCKYLLQKYNQLHAISNLFCLESDFHLLFNELFKPCDELQNHINQSKVLLGENYVSASFRFRELLGDFSEGFKGKTLQNIFSPTTLSVFESDYLINYCFELLETIYYENKNMKVFVASDSNVFLEKAKKYDFVYSVPGAIGHISHCDNLQKEIMFKTLLDFYLIAGAKQVNLIVKDGMYISSFPYRASLVNNRPFVIRH